MRSHRAHRGHSGVGAMASASLHNQAEVERLRSQVYARKKAIARAYAQFDAGAISHSGFLQAIESQGFPVSSKFYHLARNKFPNFTFSELIRSLVTPDSQTPHSLKHAAGSQINLLDDLDKSNIQVKPHAKRSTDVVTWTRGNKRSGKGDQPPPSTAAVQDFPDTASDRSYSDASTLSSSVYDPRPPEPPQGRKFIAAPSPAVVVHREYQRPPRELQGTVKNQLRILLVDFLDGVRSLDSVVQDLRSIGFAVTPYQLRLLDQHNRTGNQNFRKLYLAFESDPVRAPHATDLPPAGAYRKPDPTHDTVHRTDKRNQGTMDVLRMRPLQNEWVAGKKVVDNEYPYTGKRKFSKTGKFYASTGVGTLLRPQQLQQQQPTPQEDRKMELYSHIKRDRRDQESHIVLKDPTESTAPAEPPSSPIRRTNRNNVSSNVLKGPFAYGDNTRRQRPPSRRAQRQSAVNYRDRVKENFGHGRRHFASSSASGAVRAVAPASAAQERIVHPQQEPPATKGKAQPPSPVAQTQDEDVGTHSSAVDADEQPIPEKTAEELLLDHLKSQYAGTLDFDPEQQPQPVHFEGVDSGAPSAVVKSRSLDLLRHRLSTGLPAYLYDHEHEVMRRVFPLDATDTEHLYVFHASSLIAPVVGMQSNQPPQQPASTAAHTPQRSQPRSRASSGGSGFRVSTPYATHDNVDQAAAASRRSSRRGSRDIRRSSSGQVFGAYDSNRAWTQGNFKGSGMQLT